ncbi:MAG: hypothetical protein ACJASQ_002352 [Crocinitomicaceae bacterium]|jgi:hypothetical protein
MKYLPFENITYKTKLESEEALNRLGNVIEAKKTFRMTGLFGSVNHNPYEGSIHGNSFKINRIIGYRNSFLPQITGVIEKDYSGTKIKVKMRLHTFVIVFLIIWVGIVGIACLSFLSMMFTSQDFQPMNLIPFGMLIFVYALVTGGFKYESIKSKKYLAQLFEAEIEQ